MSATATFDPGQRRRRRLVTPEGIAFNLTVASKGARLGALILDLVIISALQIGTTLLLMWIAGGVLGLDARARDKDGVGYALQFLIIVWFAVMFLFRNGYFLFFELGPRGATPGKRMLGIRVAARDGGRLSAEMVLARNLLRDIELFLPLTFLFVAKGGDMGAAGIAAAAWFLIFALFPFFNRDALRAGDLVAGTWVVEAPRSKLLEAISLSQTARGAASAATGTAYRFSDSDLAIYGEYELQTLERVLREGRTEALAAVQEAICRKLGWDPGSGDERAFLEAYYTQLRGRLEGGMRLGVRKTDKWEKAATFQFSDDELSVYGEKEMRRLEQVLREGRREQFVTVHEVICTKIGRYAIDGEERAFLEAFFTQLRGRLSGGSGKRKVGGQF